MRALGMIETMGLIPSIEALDAMLKAANVETLEKTNVRGGIVTVLVAGDVSAVKAAVDAGAAAAQRVSQGALLSQHVIPRPDSQTEILFQHGDKLKEIPDETIAESEISGEEPIASEQMIESEEVEASDTESEDAAVPETKTESEDAVVLHTRAELEAFLEEQGIEELMQVIKHMRNSEIKKLARGYRAGELQVDKSVRATKAELVNKLYKFYSKEVKE